MLVKHKKNKKWLISFFLYLLILLLFGISLIKSVTAQTVVEDCEVSPNINFCDCDYDCTGLNEICVTEITNNNIRELCDSSVTKINLAKRYESKLGFCAVIHSTMIFPDNTKNTKFFSEGTRYCPLKKINDSENTINVVNNSTPFVINTSINSSQENQSIVETNTMIIKIASLTPLLLSCFLLIIVVLATLFIKEKKKNKGLRGIIELRYGGSVNWKRK